MPESHREKKKVEIDRDVSYRIELEIVSPLAHPSSQEVEELKEVQNINKNDNVDASMRQQSYSIATGNAKRVINRPKIFANIVDGNLPGYANLLELVAKTID
ncbi:hypothetical protein HAX54_015566, partial [Datura stramonium]|nr:hypothetical protein [Datura stramonium]